MGIKQGGVIGKLWKTKRTGADHERTDGSRKAEKWLQESCRAEPENEIGLGKISRHGFACNCKTFNWEYQGTCKKSAGQTATEIDFVITFW